MGSKAYWRWFARGLCPGGAAMSLAVAVILVSGRGGAGHSVGHFPSFYPDEIRIDVVDPAAAAKGLADMTLHAYVGGIPEFTQPVPDHVKSIRSLGAFVLLSPGPKTQRLATEQERCTVLGGVTTVLGRHGAPGFVFTLSPITPFHADYLHHVTGFGELTAALHFGTPPLRQVSVAAKGRAAETAVEAKFGAVVKAEDADAIVEVVPVEDLLAADRIRPDGGSGPPWLKEGWFHAYRLLAPSLDATQRAAADDLFQRLVHGGLRGGLAERIDLERRLLTALTKGCHRVVLGFTM